MSTGSCTMFQEFYLDALSAAHNLSSNTLKLGIVDDTLTPTANIATPRWSDFSANEVSAAGNYVSGGMTLTTVSLAMSCGICTLTADDVLIAQHASGFTDGYWGILYNSSATNGEAIGFIDLGGPVSEQAAPVSVEWPSGVVGQFPANVTAWATPVT